MTDYFANPIGASLVATRLATIFQSQLFADLFDPTTANLKVPDHRAESTEEEKQTQGGEKHGEYHNQI